MGTNATIYFSTSHNRWVIEAPDVYWEANQTHYLKRTDAAYQSSGTCTAAGGATTTTSEEACTTPCGAGGAGDGSGDVDGDPAENVAPNTNDDDCNLAAATNTWRSSGVDQDAQVGVFNNADDRRRFHGLSAYFGENSWFQFSLNYPSGMVAISIVCFDTRHPTIAPSTAPTTAAPTLAPTELCSTIEVTVDESEDARGSKKYH